jgi:hypothetical protein
MALGGEIMTFKFTNQKDAEKNARLWSDFWKVPVSIFIDSKGEFVMVPNPSKSKDRLRHVGLEEILSIE